MVVLVDFEPTCPGFKSRESYFFFILFIYLFFLCFFLSLLLQCKFENLTLLSLLSFSYFITPYDAQAFSALILIICPVLQQQTSGRVAQSVGHLTRKSGVLGSIPGLATYFRFSFRFFKKGSCQLLAKVCARSTG